MSGKPIVEKKYKKGNEVINYVVYESTTGEGKDEVLQHKLFGTETAHITLHPDGSVNFRVKPNKKYLQKYLQNAIRSNLVDFNPNPSQDVERFISKIPSKILINS